MSDEGERGGDTHLVHDNHFGFPEQGTSDAKELALSN
jgi:hypothetical protein